MEQLVSLAKRRGFVFPGSEIYGGLANAWDFGPLGVELKNNLKRAWWRNFVHAREDVVGLDSAILMNPAVWRASGHLSQFTDPLVDCRSCKARHRADSLVEAAAYKQGSPSAAPSVDPAALQERLQALNIPCPRCGARDFTAVRPFNLMFKTYQGPAEDSAAEIYLRPETAQGIFVNFRQVQTVTRRKLPFGIAQIGKSFRNEITPGNFIFRTREFEQMELEYFCMPQHSEEYFAYWKEECQRWLHTVGLPAERLRLREHGPEELSHYSRATVDLEYEFPFGWGELWGIAHRGDYDLRQHQQGSGRDLALADAQEGKLLPEVIEPALGVERLTLAVLASAWSEETVAGEPRVVLRFAPQIAPVQVAVFPLSRKLAEPARKLAASLRESFVCDYDEAGSIGRRYRRHDEIGTPFCITFDFQSEQDGQATLRDRDCMSQERIPLERLAECLRERLR